MLPQYIPIERIERMEQIKSVAIANTTGGSNVVSIHADSEMEIKRLKQTEWLEAYGRTLTPRIACECAGVSLAAYRNWRKTDPVFCREYNETLENALEELQASVWARAVGYHQMDEDGMPVYDASGKPVYAGGSDKLAVALLGIGNKEETSSAVTVRISIVSRDDNENEGLIIDQ